MDLKRVPEAADAVITSTLMRKLSALSDASCSSRPHLVAAWAVASIGATFFALTEVAINVALATVKAPFTGYNVTIGRMPNFRMASSLASEADFLATLANIRRALLIQWQALGVLIFVVPPSVMVAVGRSVGLLEAPKDAAQAAKSADAGAKNLSIIQEHTIASAIAAADSK